jgi:hypothetical protein
MTLVSSIINDAYRETNINPIGKLPSDAELAEGLRRLQSIVMSVYGNEAGEQLNPFPLGRNEINSPAGYPWYQNQLPGDMFIPVDCRIMANLTGPGYLNLHPKPDDGARMALIDVSQNLSVYPLTIYGNGRSIEGDDFQVYSTDGINQQWFYRDDLANWVKVSNLALTDEMPFPFEFDDMFIILLASRINPRYGQSLDPSSVDMLKRSRTQFRARYAQTINVPVDITLLQLPSPYGYGRRWYWGNDFVDPTAMFNAGYPL